MAGGDSFASRGGGYGIRIWHAKSCNLYPERLVGRDETKYKKTEIGCEYVTGNGRYVGQRRVNTLRETDGTRDNGREH
eukprot:6773053-Prymnesium_polylepis.1